MSKLGVFDVSVRYGKVPALSDATFTVAEGERLFISGPNGAGKSSLLKAICGAVPTSHGRIELDGDMLNGRAPETIARLGLTMVPEGREIFGTLTVEGKPSGWHRHSSRQIRGPGRSRRGLSKLPDPWENGVMQMQVPCPADSNRCLLSGGD